MLMVMLLLMQLRIEMVWGRYEWVVLHESLLVGIHDVFRSVRSQRCQYHSVLIVKRVCAGSDGSVRRGRGRDGRIN